jgi:hypothetical protein
MISKKASQELYAVMKEFVDAALIPSMLDALQTRVPGNQSYRDTIEEVKRLAREDD